MAECAGQHHLREIPAIVRAGNGNGIGDCGNAGAGLPGMEFEPDERTLRDYVRVVRQRKFSVFLPLAVGMLAAVLFSLNQQNLYQASTEVLLNDQNLAASLTGTLNPSAQSPPDRIAETQARLARVPAVAARVIKTAGLTSHRTVQDFLNASSVSAETNADLLEFRVRDPDRELAMRLATTYARQFTLFRRELDTASIATAIKQVHARVMEVEAAGDRRSQLHTNLVTKEEQLQTLEALQTSNASLVRPATEADQVQPRPLRNGAIGAALGLLFGVALAFTFDALDTRPRSATEISERLRLPLLGRIPDPSRRIQNGGQPVMLVRPESVEADMFRILRTNFEFANLGLGAHLVMVTSAVEGEGKSTVAANLALSLARAGRRALLVDLDLRRPALGDFFGLHGAGFTDVALGRVRLDRAIARVKIFRPEGELSGLGPNGGGGSLNEMLKVVPAGQITPARGVLKVLPAGQIPSGTGEFMTLPKVDQTLQALREYADIVLIDAPPLLGSGDGIALSAKVDGVLAVVRSNATRSGTLDEFHLVLESSPAAKLGFVLTDSERKHLEYYRREDRLTRLLSPVAALGGDEVRKSR